MRALVVEPAAAERIAVREVDAPEAGPDQELVTVRAISLNRGEVNRIAMAAEGWRPGWDIAGLLPDGRRVVGVLDGAAWAEQVAVPAGRLAELPPEVSFAGAAALPVAGLTALRILRFGRALMGSRVLVTGASGGVGRFAIQLARRGGAHITAIAGSEERAQGLRELGADEVVIGHQAVRGRYDLVLESAGGESLAHLMTCVDPDGTLVMFGNSSNQPTTFNVRDVYLGGYVRLQGFTLFHGLPADPPARDLAYLVGLVARGELDPQVAGELPWERITEAIARLRERSVPGKLILTLPG
ncbi:MAG TPA: zinc-binding dehydrogenase [Candidatus Dormibacteraeota bacterium]